jgi:hypothetical protein
LLLGYFPTDKNLADTAVLAVPTFETSGDGLPSNQIKNFALEAQNFVDRAIAAGKSKIIIDVTGNGGGIIDSGFGLLSVFFPNMTIFSATRFRSVPATQFIVETATRTTDPEAIGFFDGFVVPKLVKPDQKSTFSNVGDFLGPFYETDVPSTALVAGNNFIDTDSTTAPINIFGKGGQLNGTAPPFKPENIVIVSSYCSFSEFSPPTNTSRQLTDGICASTCTIFINHMSPYGVRVVASGGRARPGPMQAIGGVKGSQTLTFDTISNYYEGANQLVQNATKAKKPLFTDKEYAVFKDAIPITLDEFPIRLTTGQINFRNAFAPFNDELPTHYIYQPADFRLFYTPQALSLPETLWVNTANAVWGNGGSAFSVAPHKPILTVNNSTSSATAPPPASTSAPPPASTKKKTQSSAHKAVGLLLAMAEGLRPQ